MPLALIAMIQEEKIIDDCIAISDKDFTGSSYINILRENSTARAITFFLWYGDTFLLLHVFSCYKRFYFG